MELRTLTNQILRELIDHIDVYEVEGSGTSRTQRSRTLRQGRRAGIVKKSQARACDLHRALFVMAAVAFVDRFRVKGSRMLVRINVAVFLIEIHVKNFIPMTALL